MNTWKSMSCYSLCVWGGISLYSLASACCGGGSRSAQSHPTAGCLRLGGTSVCTVEVWGGVSREKQRDRNGERERGRGSRLLEITLVLGRQNLRNQIGFFRDDKARGLKSRKEGRTRSKAIQPAN